MRGDSDFCREAIFFILARADCYFAIEASRFDWGVAYWFPRRDSKLISAFLLDNRLGEQNGVGGSYSKVKRQLMCVAGGGPPRTVIEWLVMSAAVGREDESAKQMEINGNLICPVIFSWADTNGTEKKVKYNIYVCNSAIWQAKYCTLTFACCVIAPLLLLCAYHGPILKHSTGCCEIRNLLLLKP